MDKIDMARPLKFETVEILENKINDYFESTPKEEWTITGLALALDTYRQTLINYQGRDEFVDTIKKAKQKVENSYELDLKKHGRAGTIFALKNFDWKDRQETDITSGGRGITPIIGMIIQNELPKPEHQTINESDNLQEQEPKAITGGQVLDR
jgi:hypothetical protein